MCYESSALLDSVADIKGSLNNIRKAQKLFYLVSSSFVDQHSLNFTMDTLLHVIIAVLWTILEIQIAAPSTL